MSDGGKGSTRRNEDVSKVKSNWDLIDWSNKGTTMMKDDPQERSDEDGECSEDSEERSDEEEWTCEVCGGPMYRQPHWGYGQCDDCGARQELINDDYI